MLEKIKAEIKKRYDDCEEDWENGEQYGYSNCLKISTNTQSKSRVMML